MAEAAIVWIILGVILGLFVDIVRKMFKKDDSKKKKRRVKRVKNGEDEEEEQQEESDWVDDDSDSECLNSADGSKQIPDDILEQKYPIKDVKMVLVVREDLKMGKGKIGAQCGHATLGAYKQTEKYSKESEYWKKVLSSWSWEGQKKVCLKVSSEQELQVKT